MYPVIVVLTPSLSVPVNMSSGTTTRSSRSGSVSASSKTDDVPVTITVDEIQKIVQNAVASAATELRELFNNKLRDLCDRVGAAETRISSLEDQLAKLNQSTSQSQSQVVNDLSEELQAVRTETRASLLASNDNEQYSRRNNLRLCGLKSVQNEDCRVTATKFIRETLHVSISDTDVDVAHMTTGSLQPTTDGQQRRPTMLVRFCRRDVRDRVIRNRRALKGTSFAITEDLTNLNIKMMNRLKNHSAVTTSWSWNGKLFAILSNGKKVAVRPFQTVEELLSA